MRGTGGADHLEGSLKADDIVDRHQEETVLLS